MAATTSFLSKVKKASELKLGTKLQLHGPSGSGKSHDIYKVLHHLGLKCLAIDSDATVDKFTGREGFGDPDSLHLFTIKELIGVMEEVIDEAKAGDRVCDALFVDSLSNIVDMEIRRRGIDVTTDGMADATKTAQADWARDARYVNLLMRQLSAFGIHFIVSAETRTRYKGARIDAATAYDVSALSPRKFRYPFDAIVHKSDRTTADIDKTRYEKWPNEGFVIKDWDAIRELGDILSFKAKKQVGLDDFNPFSQAHEDLMQLLKKIGTEARGGKLTNAEAKRLATMAKSETPEEVVAAEIKKLESLYASHLESLETATGAASTDSPLLAAVA